MSSFEYNRTSKVFVDVNIGVKNRNVKFPLILNNFYSNVKIKIYAGIYFCYQCRVST